MKSLSLRNRPGTANTATDCGTGMGITFTPGAPACFTGGIGGGHLAGHLPKAVAIRLCKVAALASPETEMRKPLRTQWPCAKPRMSLRVMRETEAASPF